MPNWVDGVIVVICIVFFIRGLEHGFIATLSGLVSWIIALFVSVRFHGYLATFSTQKFGIPPTWSTLLFYLILTVLTELIVSEILQFLMYRLPTRVVGSRTNKWFGAFVSLGNALLFITFLLLLIMALPLKGSVKNDIRSSFIGTTIMKYTNTYLGTLNKTVDQALLEAQKMITIPVGSKESVTLDFDVNPMDLHLDEASEHVLVDLINKERSKIGLSRLFVDGKMVTVAREYARQVLVTKFFSHVDHSGEDVGTRLTKANIVFVRAAENLAFAPSADIAHAGLMASDGHRINILDLRFRRVAVGVIEAGIHGKMVVELFAD